MLVRPLEVRLFTGNLSVGPYIRHTHTHKLTIRSHDNNKTGCLSFNNCHNSSNTCYRVGVGIRCLTVLEGTSKPTCLRCVSRLCVAPIESFNVMFVEVSKTVTHNLVLLLYDFYRRGGPND